MSKLPPKKYLSISSIRDVEEAKRLPLAIIIEKVDEEPFVYKVESKDVEDYFIAMGGDPMPFVGNLLHAVKKFGKTITKEEFLNESVLPAQVGVLSGIGYAIYRAKFDEPSEKCDKKTGVCT
jgi:hypothetical protein